MSENNVLSQSATTLTTSGNVDNFPWEKEIVRIASKDAKGITRERLMLNKRKLKERLAESFRAQNSGTFAKGIDIPRLYWAKAEVAVDAFVESKLKLVHTENVISARRHLHLKGNELVNPLVERVTLVGENMLTLEEQHAGLKTMLLAIQKKIKVYFANKDGETASGNFNVESALEKEKKLLSLMLLNEAERGFQNSIKVEVVDHLNNHIGEQ